MIHRLRSLLIGRKHVLFLAAALLFAQFVLIAHQIDHQSHAADASCDMCLTAQHSGSTPASKNTPLAIPHAKAGVIFPATVGLLSQQSTAGFSARAPPFFLHA